MPAGRAPRLPRLLARRWLVVAVFLAAGVGFVAGAGAYTFVYAKGASYLGTDSSACANCHIMSEQYAGWTRSSHHDVAGCNDCHAPHDVVGKYFTKARSGALHAWAFTTGRFHEPIQISEHNRRVTEGTCRSCHAPIVDAIDHAGAGETREEKMACTRCHASVGHLH